MASPIVCLEGLFTTLVIDAYEGREVATFDVLGEYLHADMPKDKKIINIKRNICEYNVSDQFRSQE